MTDLFEFDEDFNVVVKPQALTLKPFANVMAKYKDGEGLAELSYIVFLLHPKSDFSDIRDESERSEVIVESMVGGDKIIFDDVTKKAVAFFKERSYTTKTLFLSEAYNTLDKTTIYLKDVDYSKRDAKANLLYKPKDVIDIITQSPKLMASIKELEDQIRKELEVENSLRGSGKKGVYED